MKNKIIALFLALSMAIFLVSCGTAQTTENSEITESIMDTNLQQETLTTETTLKTQYPLTIDVYNINEDLVPQTYEEAPSRVIPYTASAVYTMLELGLEDKIIGIMKPDNLPPEEFVSEYEQLTVIGDKTTVSKESIVALEPDLLFGRVMSLSDDSMGTLEDFNAIGINAYTQKASSFAIEQSLDNIFEDIQNIGKIFDVQDKANAYVKTLEERLNSVKQKVAVDKSEEPLTAILMVRYDDGTFSAFGSNSTFQNAALSEINMVNVVSGTAGEMTVENLVDLNPDVIIYVTADRNSEFDQNAKENILTNPTLSDVSAVKNNKYVEIPYESLMDYGPSTFDAIEMIYEGIYVE